jgi:transglutaminase-like putative cysteine protease
LQTIRVALSKEGEAPVRLKIDAMLDYQFAAPADVLLALEVAQLPDQLLVEDELTVSSREPLVPVTGEQNIGRRTWVAAAEGRFTASYRAIVDVDRALPDLRGIAAVPLRELPGDSVQYLWPSRYCRADKHGEFAADRFGHLSGGALAVALADWTRENLSYTPGSSDEDTTSIDTFLQRQGMCRDYAHLCISFARALGLPARMVSAYAWQLDPPDFHAVVEIFLEGGWHLLDPTGLAPTDGLVRIGVGRDAADVSFMSIFGAATLNAQSVAVERID